MHLKTLTAPGILVRLREPGFPGGVSYELSDSGRDLLQTLNAVSAWLAVAPTGPMEMGTAAAKSAIKALIDGWSTKILRALAGKPLSLTELNRLLPQVNYPTLERRLVAMRLAGQIAASPERSGTTPYKVTKWLRTAVGPLASAVNWEQRHARQISTPLSRIDIEAIFLLAVPLLHLPSCMSGSCRLAVVVPSGDRRARAGTVVDIDQGRPVAYSSDLSVEATSSATGSAVAWLSLLSARGENTLKIDGDGSLGDAVVVGLPEALICQQESMTVT
jgi:DNA-binding HxlR family transcriptional regulator